MHLPIATESSYIILIVVYTVCSHEIFFVSCKKSRTIIQLEFLGIIVHTLQLLCRITFTPTVQHCSMATVTGLCLRLTLMQNPRDLVRLRPSPRLDTCMRTQPRPQLSGNQDSDSIDGILEQPASFCLRPSPTMLATCIQLFLPRASSTWLLVS
ncbi:hypothetical protein CFC21_057425 [Triticum aestivum]|uniref:Uncharacterized protein n=2 Tax=Triticum aestivum TaxID=4565 RepID=A0A3B6IQ17_WHEAT|nr:hypothetical protein CFC21_057425 [Triticum aestivum]